MNKEKMQKSNNKNNNSGIEQNTNPEKEPNINNVNPEYKPNKKLQRIIEQKLEEKYQAQIKETHDKMLRAVAEGQNIKRRAEIDVSKARDYSNEKIAKDLIGVLDHLYRSLENITDEDEQAYEKIAAIKEGIEITKKEMTNAFERNGIKRIFPLQEKFNHDFHQAISHVPNEKFEAGTVIDVIQAGYTLNNRLIRPALVAVSKGKE